MLVLLDAVDLHADNDPLNKTDPLGLRPGDPTFATDEVAQAQYEDNCQSSGFLPDVGQLMVYGSLTYQEALEEQELQLASCRDDLAGGAKDRRKNPSGVTSGGGDGSAAGQTWAKAIQAGACLGHQGILITTCKVAMDMAGPAEEVSRDVAGRVGDSSPSLVNAARHYAWSALIASEVQPRFLAIQQTLEVTDIHEYLGLQCAGTARECEWDRQADTRNNRQGALFGRDSLRRQSLGERKRRLVDHLVSLYPVWGTGLAGGCPSRLNSVPQGC